MCPSYPHTSIYSVCLQPTSTSILPSPLSAWLCHRKNHHLDFSLLTFYVFISSSISIFFSPVFKWVPFSSSSELTSHAVSLILSPSALSEDNLLFPSSFGSLCLHRLLEFIKSSIPFKFKRTYLHFLLLLPLAGVHHSLLFQCFKKSPLGTWK